MLGITDYFWRLIPANPILLRVVEAGGKRRRDLIIRCLYLGFLVGLVLISLASSSSSLGGSDLGDLAKASARIFRKLSYLQLGFVALLAPIFTAGSITQEKDSQTYDILLSTPLTNGQVVLGSLLSRLFFVIALLISGIPIFSVTQIFGGVAIDSIVMSFLIAAATAFVTGALAMAIATFKVGTRRTIFSFYLFIVIYLVGLALLDQVPYFWITSPTTKGHISWFTGIHPFLALRVIFNDPEYTPPLFGSLPPALQRWPLGWYFTSPQTFYVTATFFLSFALVLPSIVMLRRVAQSTISLRSWVFQKLRLSTGNQGHKPRFVWNNPIAWREAKTKASAARASLLRYSFIAAGLLGAIAIVVMHATEKPLTTYLNPDSYDSDHQILWVFDGDTPKQYHVPNVAVIKLNGAQVPADALNARYSASNITVQGNNLMTLDAVAPPRRLSDDDARQFLLGAVIVEFAVILLIVTNAAASTVTREKEDGSLDLLLTTPITSRYYIWGKLRGLVSFVLPLVAVPVASVVLFVAFDLLRFIISRGADASHWIVFPESALIMPGTLVIVVAFAAILGMNMSLRFRTTVQAVMISVGIVVAICGTLGWCGYSLLERGGSSGIGLILSAFSPFTILTVLVDPYRFGGTTFDADAPSGMTSGRLILFFFGWAATAAYAAVVWSMYKAMVKNFDMTIRRQSR